MIIKGRFSFVNLVEPRADLSGNLKYGLQVLIPKDDTEHLKAIRKEIASAMERGVSQGRFRPEQTKSSKFKNPLRDGDEFYNDSPSGAREVCRGHYFINANNTYAPGVVDKYGRPIDDLDQVYSGCYGLVDIQFFAFNTQGNFGLGASLQNVMKQQDGDRLDGRQSAEQVFKEHVELASSAFSKYEETLD